MGVLALQGDVREHLRALTAAGADARPVRVPGDLADLDGVVLPGGESTTIGRLLALSGLLEPLRELLGRGLPAYGSCAGLVLLADEVVDGLVGQPLLGGLDVTVRRNAFGAQAHSFEAALALAGLDAPVHGVFIRAPWVERAGAGVEVLASVDGHPVAVRQGALLATSFHPELTGDLQVHALFVDQVRTRQAQGGRAAGHDAHDGGSTVSGHSKWATTKHKKAVVDAKRGKLFAKLIKTIEVAARTGGGDPSGNPTLADAIAKAKGQSVPNDNIDRAVKRGSGELGDAAAYEEITYEAYGPGGVAVLVECLTDNRNRAAAEVRTAITRNGGNPADPGSVSYLFGAQGRRAAPQDRRPHRGRRAAGGPGGRARRTSTTSTRRSRWSATRPTRTPCGSRRPTPG